MINARLVRHDSVRILNGNCRTRRPNPLEHRTVDKVDIPALARRDDHESSRAGVESLPGATLLFWSASVNAVTITFTERGSSINAAPAILRLPFSEFALLSRGVTIPRLAILVLLVGVALVGLYLWFVLSWAYSDGERAGILQKFSRKGWICKTHEGELAISIVPGVTPVIWYFSVRDERVIPQLDAALGKRVVLHYTEHRGLPTTCFGDTSNFVNRVRLSE